MVRPLLTALLGVALCLAGGTFDMASLYLPGSPSWCSRWAPSSGFGSRRAARPSAACPGPATVVEDEPYPLRVEVRSGVLPPPGGEAARAAARLAGADRGRWSRRLRINVRFSRQGRRVLEPELLVIRDPLRMYSQELYGHGRDEVLVLPRVEPVTAPGSGGSGAGADAGLGAAPEPVRTPARRLGRRARDRRAAPVRDGAPASRIHWPSVARHGEMLERRLVAELDSAPLVVLDPSNPAEEEALDKAVRAAASLCVWLARKDGCAILLPGDRRPIDIGHDLGAWPGVHARLALVEEGPAPAGGVLGPRGGAVIWVTGADLRDAASARAAARRLALRRRARRLPGIRPAFEVAGCTGCLVERVRRGVAA